MRRIHSKRFNPLAWLVSWWHQHVCHDVYASCSASLTRVTLTAKGKKKHEWKLCNKRPGHWGLHTFGPVLPTDVQVNV